MYATPAVSERARNHEAAGEDAKHTSLLRRQAPSMEGSVTCKRSRGSEARGGRLTCHHLTPPQSTAAQLPSLLSSLPLPPHRQKLHGLGGGARKHTPETLTCSVQ